MPEIELTRGVRILRRFVIIMGFVLVFSFIMLIVAAYFKFKENPSGIVIPVAGTQVSKIAPRAQLPSPSEILPSLERPADKCIFKANSDLEIDGEIINYNLSNNILTIITANKTKLGLAKAPENSLLTITAQKAGQYPKQIIIFDLCRGEVLSRVNLIEER